MAVSKRLASTIIGLILLTGCSGSQIKTETHFVNSDTGKTDKIIVMESNPQALYQETVQIMIKAMGEQAPTLEIGFEKSASANHYTSIETLINAVNHEIAELSKIVNTKSKSELSVLSAVRNSIGRLKNTIPQSITTAFFTGVSQGNSNAVLPVVKQRQRIDWNQALALVERTPTTGENWKSGLVEGLKNLGIPLAIATMGMMHVQSSRTSEEIAPDNTNNAGGDQAQGTSTIDNSQPVTESFNTPTEIKESYNTSTEIIEAK